MSPGDAPREATADSDGVELLAHVALAALPEDLAHWLVDARAAMRGRWLRRLRGRIEASERSGDLRAAVAQAQRLVEAAAEEESSHRILIRLLYLGGDRVAAVSAYERLTALLATRWDTPPDVETQALGRLIRSTADAEPPVGSTPSPVAALSLQRPPRLVGRDQELQAAADALRRGHPLLLTGEPGIGKSRLLQELVGQAAGWVVVAARRDGGDAPYALLDRVIAALRERCGRPAQPDADVADDAASAVDRRRALLAWLAAWAAAAEPVAQDPSWQGRGIALDDLQWADDASLRILLSVADSDEPAPFGWLVVARGSRHGADRDALGAIPGARWITLALGALDAGATGELVRCAAPALATPQVQTTVRAWADGNPRLVLQCLADWARAPGTAASGALAPPETALRHVARRIERVSPPARQLLTLRVLVPHAASMALAGRILQRTLFDLIDDARELESAWLTVDGAPANDLVREAVHRSVPASMARAVRAEVAGQLRGHRRRRTPGRGAPVVQRAARMPGGLRPSRREGGV